MSNCWHIWRTRKTLKRLLTRLQGLSPRKLGIKRVKWVLIRHKSCKDKLLRESLQISRLWQIVTTVECHSMTVFYLSTVICPRDILAIAHTVALLSTWLTISIHWDLLLPLSMWKSPWISFLAIWSASKIWEESTIQLLFTLVKGK